MEYEENKEEGPNQVQLEDPPEVILENYEEEKVNDEEQDIYRNESAESHFFESPRNNDIKNRQLSSSHRGNARDHELEEIK